MDDKAYYQEITQDNPFPGEVVSPIVLSTQTGDKETYTQTIAKSKDFPTRKVAVELLGQAINTRSKKILQEFELVQSGGFKIGNYKDGVTGEVSLTPNGLLAKNKSGISTVVIDGDTGDAVFAGEIRTGALISGLVVIGDNSIVIDGETRRMVWYDENGIPVIAIGNV